ncbi:MAG TPA: protein kinase [Chlamydiales bacterium]|nr:protein kinase [Chlamydiales bacterium]
MNIEQTPNLHKSADFHAFSSKSLEASSQSKAAQIGIKRFLPTPFSPPSSPSLFFSPIPIEDTGISFTHPGTPSTTPSHLSSFKEDSLPYLDDKTKPSDVSRSIVFEDETPTPVSPVKIKLLGANRSVTVSPPRSPLLGRISSAFIIATPPLPGTPSSGQLILSPFDSFPLEGLDSPTVTPQIFEEIPEISPKELFDFFINIANQLEIQIPDSINQPTEFNLIALIDLIKATLCEKEAESTIQRYQPIIEEYKIAQSYIEEIKEALSFIRNYDISHLQAELYEKNIIRIRLEKTGRMLEIVDWDKDEIKAFICLDQKFKGDSISKGTFKNHSTTIEINIRKNPEDKQDDSEPALKIVGRSTINLSKLVRKEYQIKYGNLEELPPEIQQNLLQDLQLLKNGNIPTCIEQLFKLIENEIAITKKLSENPATRPYISELLNTPRIYQSEKSNDMKMVLYFTHYPEKSLESFFDNLILDPQATEQNTLETTIATATSLLQGLEKIHEQDIILRDIKAPNILISREEEYVFADFGYALDLSKAARLDKITPQGTDIYFSPEAILQKMMYQKRYNLKSIQESWTDLEMEEHQELYLNALKQQDEYALNLLILELLYPHLEPTLFMLDEKFDPFLQLIITHNNLLFPETEDPREQEEHFSLKNFFSVKQEMAELVELHLKDPAIANDPILGPLLGMFHKNPSERTSLPEIIEALQGILEITQPERK